MDKIVRGFVLSSTALLLLWLAGGVSATAVSSVEGHVFTDSTRSVTPLGDALVRLVDETTFRTVANAVTADDGTFRLLAGTPGRYRLIVSRPSFLPAEYGELTNGGEGAPIALTVGERIAGLEIRLAPAAIISGVIEDAGGLAASDVAVYAVPERAASSGPARKVMTDGKGAFRVTGLAPGRYTLVADPVPSAQTSLSGLSDAPSPSETLITAPVFYPGTSRLDEAVYITVSRGQAESDVRIRLRPTKPSRLTGTVSLPSGARRPVRVTIESQQLPTEIGGFTTARSILTSTDRFAFADLAPGQYRITAATTLAGTDVAASERVTLEPEVPIEVALFLRLKPSLIGRVSAVDGSVRAYSAQVIVARHMTPPPITLADDHFFVIPRQLTATAASDGTFQIDNLEPGPYDVRVNGGSGAPPVYIARLIQDGRETPPGPVDVRNDRDVEQLIILVSSTPTIITGHVLTGSMDDWRKVLVVGCSYAAAGPAVPAWTARVDNHGQFVFAGATQGRYLLTGVIGLKAAVVPGQLEDRVCGSGVRITVNEGKTSIRDIPHLLVVTP